MRLSVPFLELCVFIQYDGEECQQCSVQLLVHCPERIAEVIKGVKFVNGIEENRIAACSSHTQHLTITPPFKHNPLFN